MGLSTKIKAELEKAMKMRMKSKELENEAKRLKIDSDSIILPIMAAYGIKNHKVEGLGTATLKTSSGSAINSQKVRENMLIKGVVPSDIDWILLHATKTWKTEYVEFKGDR